MAGVRTARSPHWTVYAGLIVTILGFLAAIGGMLWQGGYLANQIAQNDRRITKLEANMDKVGAIDIRLARMEGKIDAAAAKAPAP